MRSVPLGVLKTVEEVLAVAEVQARITHDTPEGAFSSQVVALMSHFALYEDAPLSELPEYCIDYLPDGDIAKFGNVFTRSWPNLSVTEQSCTFLHSSMAVTTVWAAIDAVRRQHSLMNILRQVIQWGGDTDSVAAIAWGIASTRYQDEILPGFMAPDLEKNSMYNTGAVHLVETGSRLMEKFA